MEERVGGLNEDVMSHHLCPALSGKFHFLKVTVSVSKKSQATSTCPCKRNNWKNSNQLSD